MIDPDGRSVSICTSGLAPKVDSKLASTKYLDNQNTTAEFRLDRVLVNAPQESVYGEVARDLVDDLFNGYNATCLAYGQTGAGKTYTMSGDPALSYSTRGLIPRSLSDVFRIVAERPEMAFTVRCSYMEIYNETLYDLLAPAIDAHDPHPFAPGAGRVPIKLQPHPLHIRTDGAGETHVVGLRSCVCRNEQEAQELLFQGDTRRVIAEHSLNKRSTRSHTIFTVHLEQRSRSSDGERLVSSKLHLVDLAGSERIRKTNSHGQILREANHINKSLTFLEQVVLSLTKKTRQHVPYRQSKLTSVLRDSLGGNARTVLVANCSHETAHLSETVSTLRFACTAMKVTNKPSVGVTKDPDSVIRRLQAEVRALRAEADFARNGIGEFDTSAAAKNGLSADQRQMIADEVTNFLSGSIPEIPLRAAAQVQEAFAVLRDLALSSGGQVTSTNSVTGTRPPSASIAGSAPVAVAADPARTMTKLRISGRDPRSPLLPGLSEGEVPAEVPVTPSLHLAATASGTVPQVLPQAGLPAKARDEAFAEFITTRAGEELWVAVQANRDDVVARKSDVKNAATVVNDEKRHIDALKTDLQAYVDAHRDELESAAEDAERPVPEEMKELLDKLSAAKDRYSAEYGSFALMKKELDDVRQIRDTSEERLANAFSVHFAQHYVDLPGAVPSRLPNLLVRAPSVVASSHDSAFTHARDAVTGAQRRGELGQTKRVMNMKRQ